MAASLCFLWCPLWTWGQCSSVRAIHNWVKTHSWLTDTRDPEKPLEWNASATALQIVFVETKIYCKNRVARNQHKTPKKTKQLGDAVSGTAIVDENCMFVGRRVLGKVVVWNEKRNASPWICHYLAIVQITWHCLQSLMSFWHQLDVCSSEDCSVSGLLGQPQLTLTLSPSSVLLDVFLLYKPWGQQGDKGILQWLFKPLPNAFPSVLSMSNVPQSNGAFGKSGLQLSRVPASTLMAPK